jgi:hypothetical protein
MDPWLLADPDSHCTSRVIEIFCARALLKRQRAEQELVLFVVSEDAPISVTLGKSLVPYPDTNLRICFTCRDGQAICWLLLLL